MMTNTEILAQVKALQEWEEILEGAKAQAEAIRDSIKQEMDYREVEELTAGTYIIRYTSVLSNRFDTTAFKKSYAEVYKQYTKQISSKRFSISC